MKIKKFFHKIFNWTVPKSLPCKYFLTSEQKINKTYCWDDWMNDMKKNFPLRYFICESIPDFCDDVFTSIGRFAYFLKSVTYKKQHLLDLRQPKGSQFGYRYGYSDVRQKMIYANFNLLCYFVEREYEGVFGIQNRIDWLTQENSSPEEVDFLNKTLELYWWVRYEVQERYQELYDRAESDIDCHEYCRLEEALEDEIDVKLFEILKLRRGFWT